MHDAKYWACEAARYACWVEQDLRDGRHDRLQRDFDDLCEAVEWLGLKLPSHAQGQAA